MVCLLGLFIGVFNTMPVSGTELTYCTKILKKPPESESFSAPQKWMVKQQCDFQTVPEIVP